MNSASVLFRKLKNDQFSFLYLGEFNDAILTDIIRLKENNINSNQELSGVKNRLFFLVAECFQNIIRHTEKPAIVHKTNNKPDMFLVRNIDNTVFISSTNLLDNSKVENLKKKISEVNKLNPDELKKAYLEALTENELNEKGGAGLGLIEMARKSAEKLKFHFRYVNYFLSLFYLQLKFRKAGEERTEIDLPMEDLVELHDIASSEDLLMVHKGNYSQEGILPLLTMLEMNLKTKSKANSGKKKAFYLVVELLQNISRHALENEGSKDGIFIIGNKGRSFQVTTGNLVSKTEVEKLKSLLHSLNTTDKEQLAAVYKEKLLLNLDKKAEGGLGLVDVARLSSKMNFSFERFNDSSFFFELSITV